MAISYHILPAKEAEHFSDFMLPGLLSDPEFLSYNFFAAIDEGKIVGLLVESGAIVWPEILSIGVAPEYQGKGVGRGLLIYTMSVVRSRYSSDEPSFENGINARLIYPHGEEEPAKKLFEECGFEVDSKGYYYSVPMIELGKCSVILENDFSKKAMELEREGRIYSLAASPSGKVNEFSSRMIDNSDFPGMDKEFLDRDISYFAEENGKICACILFKKEEDGQLLNTFLYYDKKSPSFELLLCLFSAAALSVLKKFKMKTKLVFWIRDDTNKKLLRQIFPKAKPYSEVLEMDYLF